jgi:opacity protein-like surface antigen
MTDFTLSLSRRPVTLLVLAIGLCFLPCLTPSVFAQDDEESLHEVFNRQNQIGLRLGGWVNMGDEVPANLQLDGGNVETDINDGSFYLEGYYAYRFMPILAGELSFGFATRGDVITTYPTSNGDIRDIGALNVYPILVQLKLYAPFTLARRMQLYVSGGGGIYYGRNSIQITNESYYATGYRESSDTDLNFVFGGGLEYILMSQFALDANVKYMPISFGDKLLGVEDWSATTITVGIKYLFTRIK